MESLALSALRMGWWLEFSDLSILALRELLLTPLMAPSLMMPTGVGPWRASVVDDPQKKFGHLIYYLIGVLQFCEPSQGSESSRNWEPQVLVC